MLPQNWAPPCNSECTTKYAALKHIPWRVFCKKGCDADGDTWEECVGECDEICYKDPVFKDHKWSAYIDRSPGHADYSEECFRACASGCGFKFEVLKEIVDQTRPNRPPKALPAEKPPVPLKRAPEINETNPADMPGISA